MRSSIIGLLVVFAMACGTGAVVAAGGGSSPGSAAQSQYKPPCDQPRPPVPSVDRNFPHGRPPAPPPPAPHVGGHCFDSFFDIFTQLDRPVPPKEGPPVPSVDQRFPQGHPPPGR